MTEGAIVPSDAIIQDGAYGAICAYNNPSTVNGSMCTAWVLQMGNMDYRRRDVTNDWKKFKGVH